MQIWKLNQNSREDDLAIKVQTFSFVFDNGGKSSNKGLLDSTCTSHICSQRYSFNTVCKRERKAVVGNKETVASQGIGTVNVRSVVDNKQHGAKLQNALYALDMMNNLVPSISAHRNGFRTSNNDFDNVS